MTNAELETKLRQLGLLEHQIRDVMPLIDEFHTQEAGQARASFAKDIQRKVDLEYKAGGRYPGHLIEPWADIVRPIINREAAKFTPPAQQEKE